MTGFLTAAVIGEGVEVETGGVAMNENPDVDAVVSGAEEKAG
jgi:hypothetical protein